MATRRKKTRRKATKRQAKPQKKVRKKVKAPVRKVRKVVKAARARPKKRKRTTKQVFQAGRKLALKKDIPKPTNIKKRGPLTMRGAVGLERSISYRQYWEKVGQAELEHTIMREYAVYMGKTTQPSLYTRFTFSVSHVRELKAGSPPLTAAKRKVKSWFIMSGLAYNLPAAEGQLDKVLGEIDKTVKLALEEHEGAIFYLEYITIRGYKVK